MLSDLHSGWQQGHARRDFRHGSELTSGVSVPPTGQHCCASGDFIYDCAVNSKSARVFKRRVGELMEGKTIKDIIYPGSMSAAESP